jgi:tRNA pseudouridine55 synthase
MAEPPSGLLVLDKPPRQTSYDCVHRVKRISGISRIGHCGTLQEEMLTLEKEYWFRAELGKQTTTGDREGTIDQEADFRHVTRTALEDAIRGFQGRAVQIYRFDLLSFEPPFWEGRVVCSRGTYIRTLVEDAAKKVGTVGVLDSLVRERVGTYHRRDGLTWDQLNALDSAALLSRLTEPVVAAHA